MPCTRELLTIPKIFLHSKHALTHVATIILTNDMKKYVAID